MKEGSLVLEADFTVRNNNGLIVNDGIIECYSYVANFAKLLAGLIGGFSLISMRDVTNALCDVNNKDFATQYNFHGNALAANADWGVQAGTDNTAVTINDYALVNKVAHGSGTGQLNYGSVAFTAPSAGAADCTMPITRDFTNASSGTVTVKEVGFVIKSRVYTTTTAYTDKYFLLMRDIIANPGVDVDAGNMLTVTYKMRTAL